jgi:hypothetical protein
LSHMARVGRGCILGIGSGPSGILEAKT